MSSFSLSILHTRNTSVSVVSDECTMHCDCEWWWWWCICSCDSRVWCEIKTNHLKNFECTDSPQSQHRIHSMITYKTEKFIRSNFHIFPSLFRSFVFTSFLLYPFFFFLLVTPGCSINVLISFCYTVVVSQNLFFLYLLCRACCASQRESVANWVFSSASKMLFLFAQWPERNVWVWVCISLVRTSALQLSHSHTRTGCRRRFCVAILYPLTEATRKRPHHATFPQHIQHRRRRKSSFRSNCSWCGVGCRWLSLLYNETLPSQRCFFLPFFFLNMVAPN